MDVIKEETNYNYQKRKGKKFVVGFAKRFKILEENGTLGEESNLGRLWV